MAHHDIATGGEILVAVDGSGPSKAALAWAGDQARRTGMALHCVLTWQYPHTYGESLTGIELVDFATEAKDRLVETVREVLGDDPDIVVREETIEGAPAPVLLHESATADLVVVGSRGNGSIARIVLGSVSEYLAAHVSCPIVIVHDHKPTRH
jgi:nucleotide-binding universal stress UspA family protein